MNRVNQISPALSLLLLLVASPGAIAAGNAALASRPNLIAIVTDDQAQWAMGAYGNREVHTPHMDRIAREGMLLTNAFVVTPVCSPSRATYLSGLYPTEHTITDFLDENENFDHFGFSALTWPTVLQRHGYATALVGKWDLGLLPRFYPTRHGFDHFFGYLSNKPAAMDPFFRVDSNSVGTLPRSSIDGTKKRFEGALPDVLTDNALSFLQANKNRPFALLLHFKAPHTPFLPVPWEDFAHYESLDPTVPIFPHVNIPLLKRQTKEYYASVSSADRNIGRLLDFLDDQQLADRTLVLFTSDNGYNLGRHGIDSKGNGRWIAGGTQGPQVPNMWDTSMRVPLVLRWPGKILAGSQADHMITHLDVFRTLLGALKVPLPDGSRVRGVDYFPLLRGEGVEPPEAIFGQYNLHNTALAYLRMVRTKRWKYVRHFHTNFMDELYSLEKDPDENDNLITRRGPRPDAITAEEFAGLKNRLANWMKSIDDPLVDDSL
jgi:uncharacterized sulfatase